MPLVQERKFFLRTGKNLKIKITLIGAKKRMNQAKNQHEKSRDAHIESRDILSICLDVVFEVW